MDSHDQITSAAPPLRVAIIGAGPAAFYAADALFTQQTVACAVDVFNRFPTPFGLVRDGVAPDHQSIKAVTRVYNTIAHHPTFRYFGNVTFGRDIFLPDLTARYDAVILAVGAPSDRQMHIPGEELDGSIAATAFVGWYNGHPDYTDCPIDLTHERAVVVGNGNVAMDVARILVTDPQELAQTDIADYALAALRRSAVREVVLLGRRGPAQAAFTNPELRELGALSSVDVVVDPQELVLDDASAASLATRKSAAKNVATLQTYAQQTNYRQPRRIVLRFCVSPVALRGESGHVATLTIEKNRLEVGADGTLKARGTGVYEELATGLVVRSVGYRGVPLPDVPFDDAQGIIPNAEGRVINPLDGAVMRGMYVVGWAKRGPTGIIGTNKPDSVATVACLINDCTTGVIVPGAVRSGTMPAIAELLASRGVRPVSFDEWQQLDAYEVAQGQKAGRPRIKVCHVSDMLDIIAGLQHTPASGEAGTLPEEKLREEMGVVSGSRG